MKRLRGFVVWRKRGNAECEQDLTMWDNLKQRVREKKLHGGGGGVSKICVVVVSSVCFPPLLYRQRENIWTLSQPDTVCCSPVVYSRGGDSTQSVPHADRRLPLTGTFSCSLARTEASEEMHEHSSSRFTGALLKHVNNINKKAETCSRS